MTCFSSESFESFVADIATSPAAQPRRRSVPFFSSRKPPWDGESLREQMGCSDDREEQYPEEK